LRQTELLVQYTRNRFGSLVATVKTFKMFKMYFLKLMCGRVAPER
jgi:hypothetical protein